ncbi:MAG: hypothetical protein H5T86_10600 [Armatimonadetes bacterium]|nr:hypothetical protein [Armatimonadota bacterium]
MKRNKVFLLTIVSIAAAGAAVAAPARGDLFSYVSAPDPSYSWELRRTETRAQGKVYDIFMVSQTWQNIKWDHHLQVYEPTNVEFPDAMPLHITGGDPSAADELLGLTLANLIGARLAILYNIPKQPLFDGLKEDALISYTWMQYLKTGDEDWILLFPMVKAAVRAMDTLEQVAQQQWGAKLRGFMVLGASKRGWTTYLTGAYDPERVIAMAPMVFDILNMPVNAYHQKEFWGSFSPQIADYTEKGLEQFAETGRGFRLFWMVDPYSYRYRLLMPKLIVLGSNDPYWPTDAVNYYWRGLSNPKLLLIAPNSGHGLDDRSRVLGALAGFFRLIAKRQEVPRINWDISEATDGAKFNIEADQPAMEGRMWVARSPIRDFRKARWEEAPLTADGRVWHGSVQRAVGQYTAAYAELVFDVDGRKMYTSTQPIVMHPVPK